MRSPRHLTRLGTRTLFCRPLLGTGPSTARRLGALASAALILGACSHARARPSSTRPRFSPSTAAPPSTLPARGVVGYVGCSQANGAIQGYEGLGGRNLWPPVVEYGGHSLAGWAQAISTDPALWAKFTRLEHERPPRLIWWQLCTRHGESDELNYQAALAVLSELGRLAPGVPVYVSAQNGYVAPHVCAITGADGPARMAALAKRLVAQGRARQGPDVGDLRAPDSAGIGANQVQPDGCHPNPDGMRALGAPLLAFFG